MDPETLYDARGRQKCHGRKHLPLPGRRGTPRRLLPPHRDGDPHLGTEIRKPPGWREGRAHCRGEVGPRTPGISPSPKRWEEGTRGVWGRSGTQKPSWDVRKQPRWLQRLLAADPRMTPATLPDRALPGETPSTGPSPKTAPAALYSLCPRSCSPLHHSCRPGAPQN